MAEEVSNRILPVLKTAAPDPTIFEEPTVFKSSKALDTSSSGFWIKMLLLLLFISLLGLNLYYYLTEGVTLITKFFGDGLENTEENVEKVFADLKDKKFSMAIFGLTDQGYEELSISIAKIKKLVQQQRAVIAAYKPHGSNLFFILFVFMFFCNKPMAPIGANLRQNRFQTIPAVV